MTGTQQISSINVQDGVKFETHADGFNAGTPPVDPNPHESNMERTFHEVLRNQETLSARIDLTETGSSRPESKGEPTRSAVCKTSRMLLPPSLSSPSGEKTKREAESQGFEFSWEEDDSDEDGDAKEFMFTPQWRRCVKASPPKFNGNSIKLITYVE